METESKQKNITPQHRKTFHNRRLVLNIAAASLVQHQKTSEILLEMHTVIFETHTFTQHMFSCWCGITVVLDALTRYLTDHQKDKRARCFVLI